MDCALSTRGAPSQLLSMLFGSKSKNKRKTTCNELFELTHRRKDKSFVDEKSASVDDAFKARKLELSQQCDDPALMPDDDAIFLEVVGDLNKEGSVYGLGSQCSSFIESSSPGASSSMLPQQISISMLHDFIERALADFGLHNEENIGRRIGKEVESRMTPYEITLLEMQNLLTALTVNLQVEGLVRVPNFARAANGDDGADDDGGNDENLEYEDDLDDDESVGGTF